ncbi:DnaB-like helicase C-terminal domain-containing protein [Bradyrhizobium erythrophlei]|uniref:DNA 5'-3' helicase n=1 Tax=Bradyrhizobium erythrophlei TaxID=1437360 RepID=A0A1H4NQG6_9BRAD|nr:DnaB-like helicase C-terminal domain-containing protein [Bradyrhizobium erythrophlei]SEB97430.1 Replicative DNA helicase [Bradyrhizobium erythrophlei]
MSKRPAAAPNRPTQNVRAEEAIIGKILGSAETFWAVSDRVSADQFTLHHHRLIFSAVEDCCVNGAGPALSLLESKLPTEFDGVGDTEAVLQILIEKAADVSSALDFVDDIVLAWRERARIELGKVASAPNKTFDQTRQDIDDLLRVVDDHDRVRHAVSLADAAGTAMIKAAEAYERRGRRAVGVLTKIPELDEVLGPIVGGTTVTLAAPSGHGKSALMAQILRDNAGPSLDDTSIFPGFSLSLEMSAEQIAYRDIASLSGVAVKKQISGDFNQKEFLDIRRAKEQLESTKVWVQDRSRMTIKQIGNEFRKAKRRYGVKQFCIDHLKLVEPEQEHWNVVRTVEYASAYTKDLAKELDGVVWQLAQLTREGQRAPSWKFGSGDIYGGGLIVENSDIIIGLTIPKIWLRDNEPEPASEENPKGREQRDRWLREWEIWKEKAAFAVFKNRSGTGSKWKEVDFNGPRMLFGGIANREEIPF